jgi:hypothetical protein
MRPVSAITAGTTPRVAMKAVSQPRGCSQKPAGISIRPWKAPAMKTSGNSRCTSGK